jgi:hypothetical protein
MYQASIRGPVLPPGRYQVKLVAGGATVTRTFAIARDARVTNVTDAELQKQYRFARDIQDEFTLTNETVLRIRRIKADIADRSAKAKTPTVTSAADRLISALTDIEGHLYQYKNRSTKDPLNFPPQLNNKFGSLLQVVDSGDAPPTDASYAVFEELSAKLSEQLTALDKLLGRDLAALNTALTAASLPAIPPN